MISATSPSPKSRRLQPARCHHPRSPVRNPKSAFRESSATPTQRFLRPGGAHYSQTLAAARNPADLRPTPIDPPLNRCHPLPGLRVKCKMALLGQLASAYSVPRDSWSVIRFPFRNPKSPIRIPRSLFRLPCSPFPVSLFPVPSSLLPASTSLTSRPIAGRRLKRRSPGESAGSSEESEIATYWKPLDFQS